ncbi:MAG: F0F1 ATP synthase subunit A [Planctomycetota bacterium]|nr:F0F1 ATP synthase subunit A [Planctomycetota bacterium]
MRSLLLLLVVVGSCFLTVKYSDHHTGGKTPFETLYMHLMPGALVTHGDDHADHAEEHVDGGADAHAEDAHGAAADAGHGPTEAEHHHATPIFQLELWSKPAAGEVAPPPLPLKLLDYDKDPQNGGHFVLYNLQIFQLAAVLLILIAFSGVPTYLKTGKGDRVTRTLAGFCHYVRDEIVIANVGKHHGEKLLPMFLSLFFFILFMNLCGLVPGSVTPTASIFVTAALAMITFGVMVIGGMVVQGPLAFWKNLVPHVPTWLWPLLFVIEVIGLCVKPVALTIRLFANLTGGHMVVLSFMGLIFFFGQSFGDAIGYASAPVAVGFAVFIMIIEGFVAFVQAYVFTVLSAIFVGASLHPEH